MRYWVGLTDRDWYELLAHRAPDEVNFWQPSPRRPVTLEPGAPFLFKLHASAGGKIVGGGTFAHYTRIPISMAWDVFGEKNGVATLAELVSRVTVTPDLTVRVSRRIARSSRTGATTTPSMDAMSGAPCTDTRRPHANTSSGTATRSSVHERAEASACGGGQAMRVRSETA